MSEKNDHHAKNYQELSGSEGHKKIGELIEGIPICMMTTLAEDGSLDARPMGVQPPKGQFEGTLWFLTRASAEKVDEIQADRHVTLTFAEPKDSKYVTLKGRATVSTDRTKIKELWKPMFKAWFPGGEDDPDIAAMRVDVISADFWEASSSKLLVMAKYAVAAATGGATPVGESGHITV